MLEPSDYLNLARMVHMLILHAYALVQGCSTPILSQMVRSRPSPLEACLRCVVAWLYMDTIHLVHPLWFGWRVVLRYEPYPVCPVNE